MITMEGWTTVRYLKEQGKSTRAIARELGMSRNTVRKALLGERPPKYTRPPRPNPKLAPFEGLVRELLRKGLIGTRMLRELRERGYRGSPAAFYRLLTRLRADGPDPRQSLRFETAPGQQGQFDWSPYTIELGDELARVVVFCLTLGYSRRKHYWASRNSTQPAIFEAIEEGFWHFGGAPKELVIDNDRSFVIDARPGQKRFNPRFLELCGHYRVQPVAARVRHPRTKGKVERPFFYLEQHLIKARHFRDFGHFCQELARFEVEELDLLVHHTTQERPIDRFQREQPYFTPLPEGRFVGTKEEVRKVSWDCLISYGGNRYSVPSPYAGKLVWVRTSQGYRLAVYSQRGEVIATHLLSTKKGLPVIQEEHYAGLRRQPPRTMVLLEQAFLEHFPHHGVFLSKLRAQQKLNPVAHLRGILELAVTYPPEALERAFGLAHRYNTFSHAFIQGLVEQAAPDTPLPNTVKPLRPVPTVAVQGDLETYQRLLEAGELTR